MTITKKDFEQYIKDFDFRGLFVDMGWHKDDKKESVTIENEVYTIQSIAEQSSFRIFIASASNGIVPLYKTRRMVENKISRIYHDHLIIFVDSKKTEQVWLLVTRLLNQRVRVSEVSWKAGKSVELLYERTAGLVFEMEEEGNITIIDVTNRFSSFNQNNEKTEKKFYDRFKKEHDVFQDFITGIDGVNRERDLDWYASLMLNRLMFCYFIQKRRFLDNDMNYLANKLKSCRAAHGKNKFYSFYRSFLKLLFHQGFASPKHNETLVKEIGRIPYLNGGLFDVHELETKYKDIDIKDDAFAKIFAFFDDYQWTLDTRDSATKDEINPDVIGYIFEKYINDRSQKGAYYTKEDITEYISKNCIIPHLIDVIEKNYPQPFVKNGDVWDLVKKSEDAYIYDAVKTGIDKKLPIEIEKGVTNVAERDGRNSAWNKPASDDFALPTEIWRETVARRQRCVEIQQRIKSGKITHINDFITYNLNIRQFAQDIIEQTNDAALVKAYWDALKSMTILDPTCGSGAFLFAALNILEPLYDSCITRMRGFVDDEDRANSANKGSFKNELKEFREVLADIQNVKHPNQSYYIYKTIILNNLYGVDIMREAVEIAKLRLFLKLVSTVEADYGHPAGTGHPNLGLEPLPDIDFNIRNGNTLVGFAALKEIERAFKGEIFDNPEALKAILDSCSTLASEFKHFQEIQLTEGAEGVSGNTVKSALQKHLGELRTKLNGYMALVYGINPQTEKKRYDEWLMTHQPFHWFAEFYRIIALNGGFDVVIGNPPYVEYGTKLKSLYTILNYSTVDCGNLHSFIAERVFVLNHINGSVGLIVPLPSINTSRMTSLQKIIKPMNVNNSVWISSFDERPSNLFNGVDQRLVIEIINRNTKNHILFTTGINRWHSEHRSYLFPSLYYSQQSKSDMHYTTTILKIKGDRIESNILQKFYTNQPIAMVKSDTVTKNVIYYRTAGGRYWKVVSDKPSGTETLSEKKAFFTDLTNFQAIAIISSTTFWWYYSCHFDMFNLKDYMIFGFRISDMKDDILQELNKLGKNYVKSLVDNSELKIVNSKTRGVIEQRQYAVRNSKPIIDKIDKVLAKHYGFTDEELDFIINYDIKYRMGGELEGEE
ncbi:hypothetical protein FACS1894147_00830 [Spirochaetia bacterium]|nr:hypothetical protein FACS1894147_00830 [Spirochaetia bacterium]